MAIDQRGRRYRVRVMINGRMFSKSYRTYEEAKARELELEQAALRGETPTALADTTEPSSDVKTMLDLYTHTCKTEWLETSRIQRDNALRFVKWVGENTPPKEALTGKKVDAFSIHLQEVEGLAQSTVNRYLSAVSVLRKVAKRQEIDVNLELSWRPEPKGRLKYYTHEEEGQIYSVLRRFGYDDVIELFVCLVDTGGRLEEVRAIKWSEVTENHVRFLLTKNDLERTVPLTRRAKAVIDRKQGVAGHLPGPFYDVSDKRCRLAWKRVKENLAWVAKDKHCVIHTFRHTCASRLAMAGYEAFHIQRWMGHKTLVTTQRYVKLNASALDGMVAGLEAPLRIAANDDPIAAQSVA